MPAPAFSRVSGLYYPLTASNRFTYPVGVRIRYSTRYSLDVQRIGLGTFKTYGYRSNTDGTAERPSVRRTGWAVIASVARHWPGAWLGAGPALMMTDWNTPEGEGLRQLAIAIDGGVTVWRGSRVSTVLRGQYMIAGGEPLSYQSGVEAPISGGEFHAGVGLVISP